jgi:DnaJ homologue, subfamily C, member 28, conserved domain
MTERKPAGKRWETWIEELIHNARETGEFDDLEGAGKPIPGITDLYDPDWWVKKLLQREKLTVLPPALELLRKVEGGLAALWSVGSETDVRARVAALNTEIAKVNSRMVEGPPTRLASLDVDEIVSEWRARRAHPG